MMSMHPGEETMNQTEALAILVNKRIKIGTCHDMLYLRASQRMEARA